MSSINQPETVREQYKTADKLKTRISIHEKYSTNPTGFANWLFSHYDFSPGNKILELGCGTGAMWKTKLHVLDESMELTLTDFSENMVCTARNTLGLDRISYGVADIEQIPYADNSFDRVIANMMLYHVPDLDRGLSEVKRVMKKDGYFYCATYGENGIIPYIAGLLKDYGITDSSNKNFTLQNGYKILKNYFSRIERLDYEDSLAVTNVDDCLDYIESLTDMSPIMKLGRKTLKEVLENEMTDGVLHVPKEYGMFVCRKGNNNG